MLRMGKMRQFTNEWKLTARTLKVVWDAMVASVRVFADEGRLKFRGRKMGNEAFINAAVWWLADQDRATQERILRAYLRRMEAYLLTEGDVAIDADPSAVDPPADPP